MVRPNILSLHDLKEASLEHLSSERRIKRPKEPKYHFLKANGMAVQNELISVQYFPH